MALAVPPLQRAPQGITSSTGTPGGCFVLFFFCRWFPFPLRCVCQIDGFQDIKITIVSGVFLPHLLCRAPDSAHLNAATILNVGTFRRMCCPGACYVGSSSLSSTEITTLGLSELVVLSKISSDSQHCKMELHRVRCVFQRLTCLRISDCLFVCFMSKQWGELSVHFNPLSQQQ